MIFLKINSGLLSAYLNSLPTKLPLNDFLDMGTKSGGKRCMRATLEIISMFYYLCTIDDNTLPSTVLKMELQNVFQITV